MSDSKCGWGGLAVAAALALVAMVPFVVQRGRLNQLRNENARLKEEVQDLTGELERVSTNMARARAVEAGGASREQLIELMRLRAEVTALRKLTNAGSSTPQVPVMRELLAEDDSADAAASALPPVIGTNGPPWNYKGYATPDDTMSTIVWAMQQGRLDTLLNSATSEMQVQLQQIHSTAEPGKLQAEAAKVKEVRPSVTYPSNENEVYVTMISEEPPRQVVIEHDTQIGDAQIPVTGAHTLGARRFERTLKLQKVGQEWKWAGSLDGTAGFSHQ